MDETGSYIGNMRYKRRVNQNKDISITIWVPNKSIRLKIYFNLKN